MQSDCDVCRRHIRQRTAQYKRGGKTVTLHLTSIPKHIMDTYTDEDLDMIQFYIQRGMRVCGNCLRQCARSKCKWLTRQELDAIKFRAQTHDPYTLGTVKKRKQVLKNIRSVLSKRQKSGVFTLPKNLPKFPLVPTHSPGK